MMSARASLPSSLRARPRENEETESLKTTLGRIYEERGHFRNVTEDGLKAEIIEQEDDESSLESVDDDEEGAEPKDSKTRPEELQAAKRELIGHVASAQNEALMALDFVSLLLSKDLPRQAELTMSPYLKQNIKPGTLAVDLWQNIEPDKERAKIDAALAKGWKMQTLQTTADSLLSAATRLENNVRRETEYWNQVLSVSEKGWSVCRIPSERHNLGVRYGFSEAQGEFRHRGLAALRADSEGHIVLDKGLGANSKAIRVRIQEGSLIKGTSTVSHLQDESEFTIEARIRHARDSLYEEELFHEMMRESRTLTSYGVTMQGATIIMPVNPVAVEKGLSTPMNVLVDLVSLGEQGSTDQSANYAMSTQLTAQAFRLLLSAAHREQLERRSQLPPPLSMNKIPTPVAPIIQPVLAVLWHYTALRSVDEYLDTVKAILSAAGIKHSGTSASLQFCSLSAIDSMQSLMSSLLAPLRASAVLNINFPSRNTTETFTFNVETALAAPHYGTTFTMTGPEDPISQDFDGFGSFVQYVDLNIGDVLSNEALRLPPMDTHASAVGFDANGKDHLPACRFESQSGRLVLTLGASSRTWYAKQPPTLGLWQSLAGMKDGKFAKVEVHAAAG